LAPARNISYGANQLDIYPAGNDNAPVVVYAHGGAWRAGSKRSVGSMPAYFNGMGYIFVSVGYTLYPRADVDRQAREIGQAIGWIRANISKYGGNPDRIAVMGHSAGCHLMSLATLSGLAPGVRALIANDTAAYDVAYLAELYNGRLPQLYAPAFRDKAKWHNWSPISYAGGGDGMPVLVAWSGGRFRDRISQRFASQLEASGHPVTRFDGSRYNHLSISSAVGRRGDALTETINQFLQRSI
jgi:acetyl esterase/lipase